MKSVMAKPPRIMSFPFDRIFPDKTGIARVAALVLAGLLLHGGAAMAGEDAHDRAVRVRDEAKFRVEAFPLLARRTPDAIRQLGLIIPNLPPEMACFALWRLAAVPDGVNVSGVYGSALRASDPIIRMTTVDVIVARGLEEDLRFVYAFLQSEEDPGVATHAVLAVARSKSKPAAIGGLIRIVNQIGVQDAAADAAFGELRRLTGADLPGDPVEWSDWWNDNSRLFR